MTQQAYHLAVDARMLDHAGIGTYIRNVLGRVIAARPEWRFTLFVPPRAKLPEEWTSAANAAIRTVGSQIYSIREQFTVPLAMPSDAALLWVPHYNVPLAVRTPLVVTIHDLAHLALPEIHSGPLRRGYARTLFGAVRRRSRAILFDSAFSRDEFHRLVGSPRRGSVVHLAVDETWRAIPQAPSPHPRPFVLFVGSVKPHKNLVGLVRAFEQLLPRIGHDLVIVGAVTGQRSIDDSALALGAKLGARVRFVGHVDDALLRRYVAHAEALVLPSMYEGFGLPALEAMAAGCPCIVSSVASLPEVCGDAALYCDPHDPADIARCIEQLVNHDEMQRELSRAGRVQAARFTWQRTAEQTVEVLEDALSGRAP